MVSTEKDQTSRMKMTKDRVETRWGGWELEKCQHLVAKAAEIKRLSLETGKYDISATLSAEIHSRKTAPELTKKGELEKTAWVEQMKSDAHKRKRERANEARGV